MADILASRSSFLSLLLLLLISSAPLLVSSTRCHRSDRAALLGFKAAFPPGSAAFATWNTSVSCCKWHDVSCDPRSPYRVTGFSIMSEDSVRGTIPPSLGDLTFLTNVLLYELPNLVGPIPHQLGNLKKLLFLTITRTNVSGRVPDFIGDLPALVQLLLTTTCMNNLRLNERPISTQTPLIYVNQIDPFFPWWLQLDLSENKLSGSIPASIGKQPELININIKQNRLSGPIPASLLLKSRDAYLDLSDNQLSGPIPATLGSVDFHGINLSRNRLTGDASFLFGQSKDLMQIDLSMNQLDFDLTSVQFPENYLSQLLLNNNRIRGSISPQIANVTFLNYFNVSYNLLCGKIPTGGNLALFDASTYAHNKCLCGAPLSPCK